MFRALEVVDKLFERLSRRTAQQVSRRNFLASFGAALVGASVLPVLPVARKAQAAEDPGMAWAKRVGAQTTDPKACNYWRYCSSDGYLCSCCGGGPATCPPGSSPSPTSWVGSCLNPDDGKLYLIA